MYQGNNVRKDSSKTTLFYVLWPALACPELFLIGQIWGSCSYKLFSQKRRFVMLSGWFSAILVVVMSSVANSIANCFVFSFRYYLKKSAGSKRWIIFLEGRKQLHSITHFIHKHNWIKVDFSGAALGIISQSPFTLKCFIVFDAFFARTLIDCGSDKKVHPRTNTKLASGTEYEVKRSLFNTNCYVPNRVQMCQYILFLIMDRLIIDKCILVGLFEKV